VRTNDDTVHAHEQRSGESFVDLVALLVNDLGVCEQMAEKICGTIFQFLCYQLEAGQYDALFARFPQATGWIEQAQHLEDLNDNTGPLAEVLQHLTYELGGNLGSVTTLLVQLERSGVPGESSLLVIRHFIQLVEAELPASLVRAVDARMTPFHPADTESTTPAQEPPDRSASVRS